MEASSWLYRPVQAGEIKEAAFQLDPNKVPGADGYNATFFQSNWSRVEEEVTHAIQSFFISGKLIKKLNHTFITLIPKSTNVSSLSDFKPVVTYYISLSQKILAAGCKRS